MARVARVYFTRAQTRKEKIMIYTKPEVLAKNSSQVKYAVATTVYERDWSCKY